MLPEPDAVAGPGRARFSAAAPASVSEERAQHPGGAAFSILVDAVELCLQVGASVPPDRNSWFLATQIWICGHGLVGLRIGQRFPFPWPRAEQLLDALLADLGLVGPTPQRMTKKRPTSPR